MNFIHWLADLIGYTFGTTTSNYSSIDQYFYMVCFVAGLFIVVYLLDLLHNFLDFIINLVRKR